MQRSAIFLDINMDGMDGLETARKIKAECSKVHIVLVTAYVNYALDGYKVKASRFLLKDDLEQTRQECMDDILREIRQEERVVEFGFVEGNVRLKVDDIRVSLRRTPAEREFYGIYFNEYRSLKNGKGEELEALPDYLEEKPSFDRKA